MDVDFIFILIHLHENQLLFFCFGIGLDTLTFDESFVEGLFGMCDLKQHRKIEVLDFEFLVLAMEKVRESERDEQYYSSSC